MVGAGIGGPWHHMTKTNSWQATVSPESARCTETSSIKTESQSQVVDYSWVSPVLSTLLCTPHTSPPLSHQLTGQWSGSLLSTKYRKGFNAINAINAIFFFLRKMKGSGIFSYGQNVKICPIYFKVQNCDFTVRTEISTCLLNSYHTCGWWPEKVRLVWYDHLTGGS